MPEPKEPEKTSGASSSTEATPQLSIKDGAMTVDGRKIVYESDLIATKKSLEGRLEQQQAVHTGAIDVAKLEVSDAQKQIAQLNAKLQDAEQARKSGAESTEDAAKLKQDLDAAKSGLESATSKILELRRANIILTSHGVVTDTQLKDKNLSQLEAFEDALKALGPSRGGVGSYATGGGTGGATPETPMDRAARILAATPVRGTRTAETK